MGLRTLFTKIRAWVQRTWRKLTTIVVAVGTTIGAVFLFLASIGAITILGSSGDVMCAGTIDDPCYTYINFSAEKNFWIDFSDHTPYGLNDTLEFVPDVQSWKIQHSWLSGWKDFSDTMVYFEKDTDYQVRIVSYKVNPYDDIVWSAFDGAVNAKLLTDTRPKTYKKSMLWEGKLVDIYPLDMMVDLEKGEITDKEVKLETVDGYEFKYEPGKIEITKNNVSLWEIETTCVPWQNDDIRKTKKWSNPEGGVCTDSITGKGTLIYFFNQICLSESWDGNHYVECLGYPQKYVNVSVPLNKYQNWSWELASSVSINGVDAIATYATPYDPYLTSSEKSQWGGTIPNKSTTILFYDFQGDCNDESGNNFDCGLKTGATIDNNQLLINSSVSASTRAEVWNQGLAYGEDLCFAFDNIDYGVSGRYFYFQDLDQLDAKIVGGKMTFVIKDVANNYDTYQGSQAIGTAKWSYMISFDTTNSRILGWYNGTVDINASYDSMKRSVQATLQIPRNGEAGLGHIDNFIFYNETCDQDDVDSWMNTGAPPVDTCTYTSGNWEVACSDDCSITSAVDIDSGNNITITGTGTFSTTKNITGWTNLRIEGTNSSNRCVVTCSAGGCFNQ